MKKIFTITLLVLMFICCKDIDKPKEIAKKEIGGYNDSVVAKKE